MKFETYLYCRTCSEARQTQRLEAFVSNDGLTLNCKKHGLVVCLTPERLTEFMNRGQQCELCERGEPHIHVTEHP